ncbi:MAG: 50S ribosomal protein L31e [Candidatus Helarchaeota archaeon]
MPRGKKKKSKKEPTLNEEIEESESEETENLENLSEEEYEEEKPSEDEILEEDTSIEEEIIEIGEKEEELGKKFKEIPTMEEEIGEILEERLYTVNLGRVYSAPRVKKRAKRAVNAIRDFVIRHMKPEGIIIDPLLNEKIWKRGIEKPPRKIRIRVTKDREGLAIVYPVD